MSTRKAAIAEPEAVKAPAKRTRTRKANAQNGSVSLSEPQEQPEAFAAVSVSAEPRESDQEPIPQIEYQPESEAEREALREAIREAVARFQSDAIDPLYARLATLRPKPEPFAGIKRAIAQTRIAASRLPFEVARSISRWSKVKLAIAAVAIVIVVCVAVPTSYGKADAINGAVKACADQGLTLAGATRDARPICGIKP